LQLTELGLKDPGSFRDPAGHIFYEGERVCRSISERARADYEFARDRSIIARLIEQGRLVGTTERPARPGAGAAGQAYVVEHERVPFVSYPYEWSYEALRTAAAFHLELHRDLLKEGATLIDSSAYNVQFLGPRPIFIDLLSIRRYREGELWAGHRQFCEQFLNPLLLSRYRGVDHQAWYRGALEGIPVEDVGRLLPWRSLLSPAVAMHVHLQARLQRKAIKADTAGSAAAGRRLPQSSYLGMLTQLLGLVRGLESSGGKDTVWGDYENRHSYAAEELAAKRAEVMEFIGAGPAGLVWDLGCNRGYFSEAALEAGASYVVGFDIDRAAVDAAFKRARERSLAFLPLVFDAANPSPNQGWAEAERKGLQARANADAAIALAFGHHLTIGKNVPIDRFTGWLTGLARRVLYEFVPKSDPMLQRLLELREDIFPDYGLDAFRQSFGRWGAIVKEKEVSGSGRRLLWIERKA
jgi:ribosomal protein L11 methylase PrmA